MLEIKGKSTSNSAVAAFINNIEASDWFKQAEIVIIQNDDLAKAGGGSILGQSPDLRRYGYDFTVKAKPMNPNVPEVEEASGPKKDRKNPKNRAQPKGDA